MTVRWNITGAKCIYTIVGQKKSENDKNNEVIRVCFASGHVGERHRASADDKYSAMRPAVSEIAENNNWIFYFFLSLLSLL